MTALSLELDQVMADGVDEEDLEISIDQVIEQIGNLGINDVLGTQNGEFKDSGKSLLTYSTHNVIVLNYATELNSHVAVDSDYEHFLHPSTDTEQQMDDQKRNESTSSEDAGGEGAITDAAAISDHITPKPIDEEGRTHKDVEALNEETEAEVKDEKVEREAEKVEGQEEKVEREEEVSTSESDSPFHLGVVIPRQRSYSDLEQVSQSPSPFHLNVGATRPRAFSATPVLVKDEGVSIQVDYCDSDDTLSGAESNADLTAVGNTHDSLTLAPISATCSSISVKEDRTGTMGVNSSPGSSPSHANYNTDRRRCKSTLTPACKLCLHAYAVNIFHFLHQLLPHPSLKRMVSCLSWVPEERSGS